MSVPSEGALPWMATKYGLVFTGLEEVTQAELDAAREYFGEGADFDKFSFVGRWSPWYTAKIWIAGETTTEKMGGLGSATYETQHVGEGVSFKPEDQPDIFHTNPDGVVVFGVVDYPRTGRSYHTGAAGTIAGPEPGSEADDWLGDDGTYYWDNSQRLWAIDK